MEPTPYSAFMQFAEQYPERLGKLVICPVSSWSRMLWGFAGNFLPARTLEKVVLLDEKKWRKEICRYVDPSQLQIKMGGEDRWSFDEAWKEAGR